LKVKTQGSEGQISKARYERMGRLGMAKFLTAKELSHYLKLSDSTIYKLAAEGELPGFKIGDSWRFDLDEITKVIQQKKDVGRNGSFAAQQG
jgi:excisionase family DNA binding protein